MRILTTESFDEDYATLPETVKKLTDKKLAMFFQNLRHPSLRIKKMERWQELWEGSITKNYRFTFRLERDICILRRIGTHDILRKP